MKPKLHGFVNDGILAIIGCQRLSGMEGSVAGSASVQLCSSWHWRARCDVGEGGGERERKSVNFNSIAKRVVANTNNNNDENLEKKTSEFQKFLQVSAKEHDRVQRIQSHNIVTNHPLAYNPKTVVLPISLYQSQTIYPNGLASSMHAAVRGSDSHENKAAYSYKGIRIGTQVSLHACTPRGAHSFHWSNHHTLPLVDPPLYRIMWAPTVIVRSVVGPRKEAEECAQEPEEHPMDFEHRQSKSDEDFADNDSLEQPANDDIIKVEKIIEGITDEGVAKVVDGLALKVLLFVYAIRDNIIDPVKDEPSHVPTLLLKLATKLIFKVSSARPFTLQYRHFGFVFEKVSSTFIFSFNKLKPSKQSRWFPSSTFKDSNSHKLIGMSYTQTQRKGSSIDPLSVDYRPLSFPPPPEDLSSNNSTLIHVHHLQPFIMLSGNDGSEFLPAIPKKEITIIHTKNEATIHIEHFFDIKYLEGISLNMNEPMLRYGIRGFYNHFQTIHPELIGRFWRYVEFQNAYAIVSDVVGNKVTFSWRPLLKSLDD
ncbi:hypothetical protein JHK86_033854 [Glycine max]|nr:hypothetical protein JHK86_033854 [Glycine max]